MILGLKRTKCLFILLLLSGCVSLPKDQQTQNLIAPPSVAASIETGLETGFFSMGDWPKKSWWEIFDSDELNALIAQALSQNLSILGIERRVAFAKQTAKVVRSKLFPLLFFDMDETWQYLSQNGLYRALNPKIPLNANLVDLTLSFTYEFDFWGKNRHLFHAALGESKAEMAEAAEVELIATTAVAQSYFALKTNLMRKQLYEELFEVRKAYFQLETQLQDSALLSRLEPLLSKERLLEAQKWVSGITEEVKTNKHLINILLGNGPDCPLDIQEDLPPAPAILSIPENLSLDLLSRRPDLMAQIWRVEALAHEVGAAKADFYPNISLTALLGLESVFYRDLFKAQSKTGALAPAIHLPIFTAGAIRANIRAKKALFDQAVYAYNDLILKSASEVADLLAFAQSIFEKKSDQTSIVQAAQTRYNLIALREQSGLDNTFDQCLAAEEWILQQLEDISLSYHQYLAAIKLTKALGGGYQSEYSLPLKKEDQ